MSISPIATDEIIKISKVQFDKEKRVNNKKEFFNCRKPRKFYLFTNC